MAVSGRQSQIIPDVTYEPGEGIEPMQANLRQGGSVPEVRRATVKQDTGGGGGAHAHGVSVAWHALCPALWPLSLATTLSRRPNSSQFTKEKTQRGAKISRRPSKDMGE